jgi:hypothetical protein
MQTDWLGRRLKNADIKMKRLCGRSRKWNAGDGTYYQVDRKKK